MGLGVALGLGLGLALGLALGFGLGFGLGSGFELGLWFGSVRPQPASSIRPRGLREEAIDLARFGSSVAAGTSRYLPVSTPPVRVRVRVGLRGRGRDTCPSARRLRARCTP